MTIRKWRDVAYYPTGKLFHEGPYQGRDMHLTVETPSWWIKKMCPLLDELSLHQALDFSRKNKGPFKTRCKAIYEHVD